MTHNKAPSKDNINVELIKYAPEEIYKEMANILNGIYERNDTGIKLGSGILLPLQKPKKTRTSEIPQAHHLARNDPESTVKNLHG